MRTVNVTLIVQVNLNAEISDDGMTMEESIKIREDFTNLIPPEKYDVMIEDVQY
jgi:hypothetical protein